MPDRGPSLAVVQRWMRRAIQDPADADVASRAAPARALIPRRAILAGEVVRPSATMTPLERLDIYNGGYLARLVEVLETDFEVLQRALGEGWKPLARGYVYAHPSRHPNLNGFGAWLPAFVAAQHGLPQRAFLAELADLEWCIVAAFHAPEFTVLDVTDLAGLTEDDWARAVLVPNPSLQLRRYAYPTNAYLQATLDGEAPEIPAPAESHLVIYRRDDRVWRMGLPAPVASILEALVAGRPLATALQAAGDRDLDFQRWFQQWSADGLFVRCELDGQETRET